MCRYITSWDIGTKDNKVVPRPLEISPLESPPIRDMDSYPLSSNGHWGFRTPISSLLFLLSHICSSCKIFYLAVVVMAPEPRATHPPTEIQTFTQVYTLLPLCMAKEPVGVLAMPWIFSTHISSSLHHYFTEKPVGVYISYLDDLSSCKSLDKTTHHYLVDLLPRTYSYMSPLA